MKVVVFYALVLSVAFVFCGVAGAEPKQNPANGHWYDVVAVDTVSQNWWEDAEGKALALGGHLAAINDSDEDAWIATNIVKGTRRNYWLGLNDAVVEGALVWAGGEELIYRNWVADWRNTGGKDYVFIRQSDGKWDIGYKNDCGLGLAEWSAGAATAAAPEPVSFALFAIGGGALGLTRRFRKR